MLNDPIARFALALDALATLALAAGLLALFVPAAVSGTVLADREVALALTVFGAVVWIVPAGTLISRLVAIRRRNP